jgi:hypothetical protein
MPITTCASCAQPLGPDSAVCALCGAEQTFGMMIIDPVELEQIRSALIGDFDVAGVLGRGGMATVYLAHDITLDRKVAIKVMSRAVLHGGGAERFRREARTAAALSHPNIIPIYAVRQIDELLFFVMKFVSGRPLDSIIGDVGTLPIPMVQAVLAQVAGALGYAHRQGVVHRDVKPANIIIDDEGWAVVTDFGIARVSDSTGLTTAGTTVGTPSYMSPEQCLAERDVTGAADQYALGVLAYEMLTGATPFAGKTTLAMMYSHVHDVPVPILEKRPDCPPDLAALVERMLAKAPAARWSTLDEAITALGAVPMAYDDPSRSQMIKLAKTGAHQQFGAMLRTPRSPIPGVRRPTPTPMTTRPAPVPTKSAGSWARAAVAAAGVIGAAIYLAPWRQRAPAEVAVIDTSAILAAAAASGTAPSPVARVDPPVVTVTVPTPTSARPIAGAKPRIGASAVAAAPVAAPAAPSETPSALVTLDLSDDESAASSGPTTSGAAAFGVGAAPAEVGPNKEAIVRTLAALADGLSGGDLPAVQRAFPALPGAEATRLGEFFAAGGRMKVRWRVQSVRSAKGGAVAQVVGSVVEIPASGPSSPRSVDAQVGLTQVKGQWKVRDFSF